MLSVQSTYLRQLASLFAMFFCAANHQVILGDEPQSPAKTHVVEMHNNFFKPASIEISVGDSIVWVNKQTRRHTTTRTQDPERFDSGSLNQNATYTHTFNTESPDGGFKYFCRPHADEMIGTVVVKPLGYRAATQASVSPFDDPDGFAWQLFVDINHPADQKAGRGIPDKTKQIGDDGVVVWETWKMSPDEVYLEQGIDPGPWDGRFTGVALKNSRSLRSPRKTDLVLPSRHAAHADAPSPFGQTAMNREAYEFIRENELYNIEGQEAFHLASPPRIINFPAAAKEIKSAWDLLDHRPIDEITATEIADYKNRFHTTEVEHDSRRFLFGLRGLHIITKDLPNWVWTSFEHKTNPSPELPDNDRNGLPKVLENTKWSNYRLRGVQLEFTDSAGQATVLANTQMEAGFQQSSSCITCHALATIGERAPGSSRANRLPFFQTTNILHRRQVGDVSDQTFVHGYVGVPDLALFQSSAGKRLYTQTDFVWSLRFAKSKNSQ